MNQNSFFKPMLAVLLSSCALLSSLAHAEQPKTAPIADLVKGEALFKNGDATKNVPACVACHGEQGNSIITQNPKLAGQHAAYLEKQLTNFTEPTRVNPIMSMTAKALSAEDVKNVTAYLSAQTPKSGSAKNKDIVEIGKKIFRGGIADKNVPACAGCHGPNGAGIPAQFPRIAGQHQDYVIAQLTNFRTGTRANNVAMTTITKRLSDDEIKAVADYVAGLN